MIKVLEKAFTILEYVACDPEKAYPLGELASLTGDAATTCANILKTMCERGYLARGEARGTYRLGEMAYGMSPYAGADTRLKQAAAEPMQKLVETLGASGVLAVLRGGDKRVLARYRSDSVIEVNMEIVASNMLFSTSTGIVMLATLAENGREIPQAKERAEDAFGSWERYAALLAQVREEGYFYSDTKPTIAEGAVPLICGGKLMGALGVHFPKLCMTSLTKARTVSELLKTAETVINQY
ncbi:MAG: helix-turn-helix domain-containing protein [Clostridiaceae bacterium]|nr:helix-turn-helix domain-containing protein [Clostridiaceae bacterium]